MEFNIQVKNTKHFYAKGSSSKMDKARELDLITVHQFTLYTLPYTLHYQQEDITIAKRNTWWTSGTNMGSYFPPLLPCLFCYLCYPTKRLEGSERHISISQINTNLWMWSYSDLKITYCNKVTSLMINCSWKLLKMLYFHGGKYWSAGNYLRHWYC